MASAPTPAHPVPGRSGAELAVEITAATQEMDARVVADRDRRIAALAAASPTNDRTAAAEQYWRELVAGCATQLPRLIRLNGTDARLATVEVLVTADLELRVRAAAVLLATWPASFERFQRAAEVALNARRGTREVVEDQLRLAESALATYQARHRGVEQVILRQRRRDLQELEEQAEGLADEAKRLDGQLDQLRGRLAAIEARTACRRQWLLDRYDTLALGVAAARVLSGRGVSHPFSGKAGQRPQPNGHRHDSIRIASGSVAGCVASQPAAGERRP